jgi:hypothetical protein
LELYLESCILPVLVQLALDPLATAEDRKVVKPAVKFLNDLISAIEQMQRELKDSRRETKRRLRLLTEKWLQVGLCCRKWKQSINACTLIGKPFRNALDKSERKSLMRYGTLLDCTPQLVLILYSWCNFIHSIIMSILFHHYKELNECIEQVEQIDARVNKRMMKEEYTTTLYRFLNKALTINNNNNNNTV